MDDKNFLQDFVSFFKCFFRGRDYFSCIYGSQIYRAGSEKSDIDVLFAVRIHSNEELRKLKHAVIDFHETRHLPIDNEVPFENKLLIMYEELEEAINLGGFELYANTIVIPKVIKTAAFLNSAAVKKRLALYALTAPHVMFGNNIKKYQAYKNIAERNIVLLAINLIDKIEFDSGLILKALLEGKNGETGELYLGYKNHPVIVEYLQSLIGRQLHALASDNVIYPMGRKWKKCHGACFYVC